MQNLRKKERSMTKPNDLDEFSLFRERMNEVILSEAPIEVKRFFSLDGQVYSDGALPSKTKELLGLACSMVLRCDDCITYHIVRCVEENLTDDEIWEAMSIALIVGGSIIIPHLRRAVDTLKRLRAKSPTEGV